jgi:plasmid stability protein
MTRTTLDIDRSVLEQLRVRAASEGKSMGQVASERLAASLREQSPAEPSPLAWTRRSLGASLVDIDDKDALWAVLDADDVTARSG